MSLIVDVEYNLFVRFLRDDTAFFWIETTKAFILIKPMKDMIARTIIMKDFKKPEETVSWVSRTLHRIGAVKVMNFTVDGKPMVETVGSKPSTTGFMKIIKETKSKVFIKEDEEEESEKEKERKKKLELTSDKVKNPPDPRKVKQEKDPAVVEEEQRKKEKPNKIEESEETSG